jgi:hypothetical protein
MDGFLFFLVKGSYMFVIIEIIIVKRNERTIEI